MITRVCFWVILALAVLLLLHTIQVEIPCAACGEVTYEESVLCRIATGWNMNYMHNYCGFGR